MRCGILYDDLKRGVLLLKLPHPFIQLLSALLERRRRDLLSISCAVARMQSIVAAVSALLPRLNMLKY